MHRLYLAHFFAAAHGLLGYFSSINTNPASFDASGRLCISPHHPTTAAPHGCKLAPINMDKCSVVRALGLAKPLSDGPAPSRPRVFYVGDGSGDLCAALSLGP